METNYQEIADLVTKKCEELLAPLYAELEALQVQPKEEEMTERSRSLNL